MDKFSDMTMFVSIVKHQGLAAAGRELGLSPATMTARLQALEERYRVKLLNRSTRHVSLTDAGRLYYGALIGALVYIIRTWGGFPDGVAFAVLLANMCVPLIDYYTKPRTYGHTKG